MRRSYFSLASEAVSSLAARAACLQKYAKEKTEAHKDSQNQQTIVNGNANVIVHRLELEHR